jgi:patatin-like phospholipase/acyl hydrolase
MSDLTRILSIDGGGIRGIIPGQVLIEVERKLQQASNNPGARIADYFDLVAGTSTGGILTCIYLCPDRSQPPRPLFSAQEAVDLYFERGDEIFDIPIWHKVKSAGGLLDEKYPADGLEEALEDYLGDMKLSELLRPCLVTAYDIKNRKAHFFRQHRAAVKPNREFLVRDACRATSAAPTFFECARAKSDANKSFPLIDGGVFANNPALCAYAEARGLEGQPTAREMAILSLGTGAVNKSYDYKSAKDWGAAEWIRPVIDIMMSGVAETVDFQLRQIYRAVNAEDQYLRIQLDLPPRNAEMDNAEQENLDELRDLGIELAERSGPELDAFVKLLL